ncbi:MAG TPA: CPBP family intramembrane glutamic endopeptidase [Bacteroidales bacterium]|nr:CPBP family intramembrane glutamic endopeptidase [Bacteroidales bacterium]
MTAPVIIQTALSANTSFFAPLAILYVSISVYLYYIVRSRSIIAHITGNHNPYSPAVFFLVKFTGLIFFGVIPFIILSTTTDDNLSYKLLDAGLSGKYWYAIPVIFLIITFLSFISAKRKNGNRSPIRSMAATHEYRFVTISGWIIYILGYEFLFRGILWAVCFAAYGFWMAFAINIIMYALAHLDQGPFMTLGAIPFGALLCYITFLTGSFLFAFLIHSWLAVNNQVFPVYTDHGTGRDLKLKDTKT